MELNRNQYPVKFGTLSCAFIVPVLFQIALPYPGVLGLLGVDIRDVCSKASHETASVLTSTRLHSFVIHESEARNQVLLNIEFRPRFYITR